jgi:uncharacterized membrane protein YqjE
MFSFFLRYAAGKVPLLLGLAPMFGQLCMVLVAVLFVAVVDIALDVVTALLVALEVLLFVTAADCAWTGLMRKSPANAAITATAMNV